MQTTLLHGDCLEVLPTLDAQSIDACVTDPPYGLAFMGKDWDHGVPGEHFWREVLRVLKPGAHLLAFGGTRTFHRLTCAIEDAGFEIRDCLMYLYGSGFPKSLDVSKAIDKAAGAEREVVGVKRAGLARKARAGGEICGGAASYEELRRADISVPCTGLARQWSGWGTALKPAWEPIILARKPLIGTVAANVERYGTGAVNVDGCRVQWQSKEDAAAAAIGYATSMERGTVAAPTSLPTNYVKPPYEPDKLSGRWPANLILDEEAAAMLDEQSGTLTSGVLRQGHVQGTGRNVFVGQKHVITGSYGGDSGGASRFFYCAKASRSERNAGLEGMEERRGGSISGGGCLNSTGDHAYARNHHPTVKPLALMRYLCRLVTPPGGTVLDPFTGSGSTGCAAVMEGFGFTGIEQDAEYVEIAGRRVEHWQQRADRETAQGALI